jgi:hypothetical protein
LPLIAANREIGLEEQRAECHPHSRRVSAANRPTNWPRIGPDLRK